MLAACLKSAIQIYKALIKETVIGSESVQEKFTFLAAGSLFAVTRVEGCPLSSLRSNDTTWPWTWLESVRGNTPHYPM